MSQNMAGKVTEIGQQAASQVQALGRNVQQTGKAVVIRSKGLGIGMANQVKNTASKWELIYKAIRFLLLNTSFPIRSICMVL